MSGSFATSLVSLLLVSPAPDKASFPGPRVEIVSPRGRFAVVWVAADASPDRLHQLLLKDRRSGATRVLRRFGRSVEVVWAPDGQRLAVTDRLGSDSAQTWVHSVGGASAVEVWKTLKAQQGLKSLAFAAGAHHVYVEADHWLSNSTLAIRVWGYGGEKPFDRLLPVELRE
jgi:hypothetical protein